MKNRVGTEVSLEAAALKPRTRCGRWFNLLAVVKPKIVAGSLVEQQPPSARACSKQGEESQQ